MWKKWINIFLAVWLINSVTYFHSGNPFGYDNENHSACTTSDCLVVNTWVDTLIQQVAEGESNAANKAHKIKYQRKYVNTRSLNFSVFLSQHIFHLADAPFKKVINHDDTGHYTIGVAILPSYYNFLFRLSPF